MDEAFCRRLQVKFFVGRLDPDKRLKILLKICDSKIDNKNPQFGVKQKDFLKKLTTNFSGLICSILLLFDKISVVKRAKKLVLRRLTNY